MRFIAALLVAASGLLTACTTGVTTSVSAHPPHADARPHALPGYIRGSKESHADRVIVFIHGVFGDGTSTWTNPATGAYFPALIRDDKTFDGVDIWVHEFDTPKLRRTYTIDELADHLRKYLNNDNVIANHHQVIFVCHSLGGLVARAYLLKYRLPVSQVPMIYFFSTPTTGADVATLASFISANPQLTDMRKMTTDSPGTIGTWQSQWVASEYNHATLSYCGYETLPIHGVQIVQRESATNLCNTRFDPIRRDHIAIVKPADNTSDESYVAFREAYRETFTHPHITGTKPALWNLTSKDPALLRVQNVTQTPNCHSVCWTDSVVVAPGDEITFNLSYRNAGPTTALDTHAYLSIPRAPLIATPITARLESSNAATVAGMITLETTGGPVLLIPVETWAYEKNDGTKHHDVPYQQRPATLTSEEGLRLGDIMPDEGHHHIVARFHCEPVTLLGVPNIEALSPILKQILNSEPAAPNNEPAVTVDPSTGGHIEPGDIGEYARWISDLHDVHDDGDLLLYLNYFNNTADVLRHLHATIELDPDEPSLLRLTLAAANDTLRSATAHLIYRPGTTQGPILMGAWRTAKNPIMLLQLLAAGGGEQELNDLLASPYPKHGNDIDLGDLPPQAQVAAALGYSMAKPGRAAEYEGTQPELKTVLNVGDTDIVVKVANTPIKSTVFAQYLPKFNRAWPLSIAITAHNTGHAVARDVRLHLTVNVVPNLLEARGRITARNAPDREGVARVSLEPSSQRTTLYYDYARVFRSGKTGGRLFDASKITTAGVPIGELDPDEWEVLVIGFLVGSPTPDGATEDFVITPDTFFDTNLGLDNTTAEIMHDVVLHVQTDGTPDETVLTVTLSAAGRLLRSKVVRLYADIPGVILRSRSATVYTAAGAKDVDMAKAAEKGVLLGELPPGTQMVIRLGYEVLANDD
jgi:pimeloyl-ACP methyl ester carboxylesterase